MDRHVHTIKSHKNEKYLLENIVKNSVLDKKYNMIFYKLRGIVDGVNMNKRKKNVLNLFKYYNCLYNK